MMSKSFTVEMYTAVNLKSTVCEQNDQLYLCWRDCITFRKGCHESAFVIISSCSPRTPQSQDDMLEIV